MSWLSTRTALAGVAIPAAILATAIALAGCSRKPPPPTQRSAASSAASAAPSPVLQWAGNEPVALVHTRHAVVARAVESGQSRVLWTGLATWVVLDTMLELVWIQGNDALDVVDLRVGQGEVIAIARGLPAGVPISSITRTTDGGSHASASPSGCDIGRSLALEWKANPRLQLLDAQTTGWREPKGSTLVGASWLRGQLGRGPGAAGVTRREFPFNAAPPAAPFSARRSKCAAEPCGKPIAFDGSGLELAVTSFEQGDCQHFGCHLYDPVKKQFATPPTAVSWGELDAVPPGSCGVYHFDRSGKRFLIETNLCTVGGACQDLGGTTVGWLSGGVDVGVGG